VGAFNGALSSLSAPELGATVIIETLKEAGVEPDQVQEAVIGNVLTAGIGQAPARQAALKAGLSKNTPSTAVNKVCAAGMKAIMVTANLNQLGKADIIAAGGMESMSNVPYNLPKERFGAKLGHSKAIVGFIKDGLWDVYNDFHMGNAAEICAKECGFNREDQDEYAIRSYKRAIEAHENGNFKDEIVPVKVKGRKGDVTEVTMDEELSRVNFDKIPKLRPAFDKEGTVTAANASSINDGAAAVLVMSESKAKELGVQPLAKIVSHASAAKAPEEFTTAPAEAMPKAIQAADLDINEI